MQKTVLSAPSSKRYFHPSRIEIDLEQFKKNISAIRSSIGNTLYCLPIKANAYGHGLAEIGLAAQSAGVDYLGVSSLGEGVKLREADVQIPILVFGPLYKESILDFVQYEIEFSISSLYKARVAQDVLSKSNQLGRVHLEVETGMNRTGSRPDRSLQIARYIEESPNLELVGIYSHLANSDAPSNPSNDVQQRRFLEFSQAFSKDLIFHLANSSAVLNLPNSLHQMVRPGLLSFGIYSDPLPESLEAIKPIFTLKSEISYFKVVEKDEGIGYGHTYRAPTTTRIATIPIGYGDGYPRALSNKGEVLIRGVRHPIVGMICMDQLMIDLKDHEAFVGEEVVLIGRQGTEEITLGEVAAKCSTIPYEILTGFTERVPRIYS